jgi:hypothetical protein
MLALSGVCLCAGLRSVTMSAFFAVESMYSRRHRRTSVQVHNYGHFFAGNIVVRGRAVQHDGTHPVPAASSRRLEWRAMYLQGWLYMFGKARGQDRYTLARRF